MTNKSTIQEPVLWVDRFRHLYEQANQRYGHGTRRAHELFSEADKRFLTAMGATAQEIYDFIEDWHEANEPDPDTVVRITAVRKDFFLREQTGKPSDTTISMNDLPPMEASLGGHRWLPRIIAKARAKLRGEMPPELMYGCGGDRKFLSKRGIDPADFLQVVWQAGDDEQRVLDYVNQRSSNLRPS